MPSYYPYKQGVDGSGIVERPAYAKASAGLLPVRRSSKSEGGSDAVFDGNARP